MTDADFEYDNMTNEMKFLNITTFNDAEVNGKPALSGYQFTSFGDDGSPYWIERNKHAILVGINIGYNEELREGKKNPFGDMIQTEEQCAMLSLKITQNILDWINIKKSDLNIYE